jgi:hypothetical protein
MLFWIAVLLYWFGSRLGVGVRWGATTSAQVRPAGSSGLTSANRLRNASLNNLLLGRPPGFPLDPFFHLVPAPIFGSNIRTSSWIVEPIFSQFRSIPYRIVWPPENRR